MAEQVAHHTEASCDWRSRPGGSWRGCPPGLPEIAPSVFEPERSHKRSHKTARAPQQPLAAAVESGSIHAGFCAPPVTDGRRFGRLISVRSVVRVHPGPLQKVKSRSRFCCGTLCVGRALTSPKAAGQALLQNKPSTFLPYRSMSSCATTSTTHNVPFSIRCTSRSPSLMRASS
jgi:hypothetical protein